MRFTIERTAKAGDILTSLSICIAAIGLVLTWQKEVNTLSREQANDVRKGAAMTLVKLDRLVQVSLSVFDDIQPLIVETSEELGAKRDVDFARDYFWKGLARARLGTQKKILDEQVESAFVSLYSYNPKMRGTIHEVIQTLKTDEDGMYSALFKKTQTQIRSYSDPTKLFQFKTSDLGNDLRRVTGELRDKYEAKFKLLLAPLESSLAELILKGDGAILADAQPR